MSKVWKKLSRILASIFSIMPKNIYTIIFTAKWKWQNKTNNEAPRRQTRLGTTIYPKYYLSMLIQIHFAFKLLNNYKVISSFVIKKTCYK
jgi:hypothetical protein